MKQTTDAALFLAVGGILAIIAVVGLVIVFHAAQASFNKSEAFTQVIRGAVPQLQTSIDICPRGRSCESCLESGGRHSCVPGRCDAQGNCVPDARF